MVLVTCRPYMSSLYICTKPNTIMNNHFSGSYVSYLTYIFLLLRIVKFYMNNYTIEITRSGFCSQAVLEGAPRCHHQYTKNENNNYFLPTIQLPEYFVQCCESAFVSFGLRSWSSILDQCGSGSRDLMTKNCKIYKWKIFFLFKNCYLLFYIPRPP